METGSAADERVKARTEDVHGVVGRVRLAGSLDVAPADYRARSDRRG